MTPSCSTVMPRRPVTTLPGLGPLPPVCLHVAQRCPLNTLQGLGTPRPSTVVDDDLDRTAPILLVRPLSAVNDSPWVGTTPALVRHRPVVVLPLDGRAPPQQNAGETSEDRRLDARIRKVRRFGYRAIATVMVLALVELVVLLVS